MYWHILLAICEFLDGRKPLADHVSQVPRTAAECARAVRGVVLEELWLLDSDGVIKG